ncbi:hypothetical protein GCM10010413_13800 [Promicromonospora sukumoe]|uniref:HEAT repeat protein n=1 Tax=Promicromonospora sukumoe TaxID=88382 RepID=A0A7W3J672_9MICO|nr:hypothetical protein [Promicromonospora sukumoe]MBA8807036.1 hypothetical protein [Promicromonospora sukumoe]
MSETWGLIDRHETVERIQGGDPIVATRSLLTLTHAETDVSWLEEFLVRLAVEHRCRNVRELAVTCIGHSARINGRVSNDAVYRSLRRFLVDDRLTARALNALSDIDAFTGRHWTSAEWILLQLSAMRVRLKHGDLWFWRS